jgi:hypothetical protein
MTAVAATPPRTRTGPALALVGGSIAAVLSLLLIASAVALLWLAHGKTDDGYYTTAAHTYATPTRALTTDNLRIDGDVPHWLSSRLGHVRIAPQGAGAFVGIARTPAVEDYLDGVAHDEISDLDVDPFKLDTARRAGEGRPAMPEAQTFWAATSTGGRPLDWKVRTGDWTAVVMNPDGSPGVRVDAKLGVKAPLIGTLGWILAIPGVLLGLAALGLIALGAGGAAKHRAPAEAI